MADVRDWFNLSIRDGADVRDRDWFNLSIRDGADVSDIETGSTCQQETGQM